MADELNDLQRLEAELAEILQQAQQQEAAGHHQPTEGDEVESEATRSYPASYISHTSAEYLQIRGLWQRFGAWIEREGASSHLVLNPAPAPAHKLFAIQEELAQGDDLFTLPNDVLASFACHDGQDWTSTTGVLGRWYLLDCQTMFTEWRDQKDMMEMGLYSAAKYTQARKIQGRHQRIDTSYWFNPRWIPIACSRGSNLGGDLICIDMAPILSRDQGQVILYMTESAERVVLADSLAQWMETIIGHLEAGVYRFDTGRKTYVAGSDESLQQSNEEKDQATDASATATASTSASASRPLPTAASATIGVEAFMYSASESRDLFILNQCEALVYLAENDLALLSLDGLGQGQTYG